MRKKTNGFLLLEMIVTLAVLGIFLLVAAQFFHRSVGIQKDALLQLQHLNRLEEIVKKLQFDPKIFTPITEKTDQYSIVVKQTKVIFPNDDGSGFCEITATAEWTATTGEKKMISIATGAIVV